MAEAPIDHSLASLTCYELQLFASFGKPDQREGDFHQATGVAITSNLDILIADHRHSHIQVFDLNGRHSGELEYPQSDPASPGVPAKVAVIKGTLHVAERFSNNVIVFNFEQNNTIMYVDDSTDGKKSTKVGIAVDDMNNTLVLEFEKGECSLVVNSFETWTSERFKLKKKLMRPNGLAAWKNMAFISDYESDFVEVFDYLGNYIDKFGREDLTKRALCLCMSDIGELHVATETDVGFKLYTFSIVGTILSVYNCYTYQREIRDIAVNGAFLVTASSDGIHVFQISKARDYLLGLDPEEGRKILRRTMTVQHTFKNIVNEDLDIQPTGLAVDGSLFVYFPDAKIHRVLMFPWCATPTNNDLEHNPFYTAFHLEDPGRMIVDQHQDKRILVIDKQPRSRIILIGRSIAGKKYLESELMVKPLGLATDKRGNIYVIEHLCSSLRVFDVHGSLINLLNCKGLCTPVDIVISEKEEMFIADNIDHCIKVYNLEGDFLRRFGNFVITNSPLYLSLYEDLVVVADQKEKLNLTYFTEEGKYVRAYETELPHESCKGVSVMKNGAVVIATCDDKYSIVVYSDIE